jgi:hypothetical protein
MSLHERLDRIFSSAGELLDAGIPVDRVRAVMTPEGPDLDRLTDDELDALAPDDDEVIPGTSVRWGDATDHELERIAGGEDPGRVFRGR